MDALEGRDVHGASVSISFNVVEVRRTCKAALMACISLRETEPLSNVDKELMRIRDGREHLMAIRRDRDDV